MTARSLTFKDHLKANLKLGAPLVASNLAQFAIHITDSIMLGWYNVTALAAATIAGSCFFIAFIVGSGFGQAVTPLVAEAAEAGDETQVRRITRMGLWLSVIYGIVMMLPFFWSEDLLLAIGQTPEVSAMGHQYLVIAIFGLVPALLVMALKSYLAALEHTGVIFWATLATAVANAILNYALIFGNFGAPELGIRGAAIASVAMHSLTVVILLGYGLRVLPQYELLRNVLKPDPSVLARVFQLGWPIGITAFLEAGLFTASAIMMGWIGTIELAAHGIAIQLASLVFVIHVALSQAATVRAGRALGRKDHAGLQLGAVAVILLSFIVVLMTTVLFLTIPEALISIFISPSEVEREAVIGIGVTLLALAALFQLVDAAQVIFLGLLRGLQDTRVPMIMAAISYWVIGLPISYLLAFPFGFGPPGLWIGLVVGLLVAAILLGQRFWAMQRTMGERAVVS